MSMQVHEEEYTEEVEEEYAAMITVENDNNDTDLDVSEFVAMSKEAHTIHLDSCCTRHMTGFYNLSQPTACVRKVMGALKGGKASYLTEMGVLKLGDLSFAGALHIPGLLYTLISEPQLDKEGYDMVASKGKRSFYKHGVLQFTATLRDGTYQLDMPEAKTCAVADAKFDNLADLWHLGWGTATTTT